jgi:hypothetical protein
MSQISIGSAVGAGFGLIGRKPLTVLAWGVVQLAYVAALFALCAPMVIALIATAAQQSQSGEMTPDAMRETMMPQFMALQGVGYLAQIGGLLVSAILVCAVTRSIVHPQRGAFAYLRIGAPELFLLLVSFAVGVVIAFALFIVAIPFAIVIGILVMQKIYVAAIAVGALAGLVLVIGSIYVLLRFAFVVPMMVDDGQFHLFDAWGRTKGKVGSLFVIGLSLVVIAILAELLIGALGMGFGAAALGLSAGGLTSDSVQAFFQLPPPTILARLAPWLVVVGLAAIPLEGCALAIFTAPWARAYRDVTPPLAPIPAVAPPAPEPPVQPLPAAP